MTDDRESRQSGRLDRDRSKAYALLLSIME